MLIGFDGRNTVAASGSTVEMTARAANPMSNAHPAGAVVLTGHYGQQLRQDRIVDPLACHDHPAGIVEEVVD